MTKTDWDQPDGHKLGMFLNGEEIAAPDAHGQRVVDDSFVLLFNAHFEDADFTLPPARFGAEWCCELRTDDPDADGDERFHAGASFRVVARSLVLLRRNG
jgi:glycogen operon protein